MDAGWLGPATLKALDVTTASAQPAPWVTGERLFVWVAQREVDKLMGQLLEDLTYGLNKSAMFADCNAGAVGGEVMCTGCVPFGKDFKSMSGDGIWHKCTPIQIPS